MVRRYRGLLLGGLVLLVAAAVVVDLASRPTSPSAGKSSGQSSAAGAGKTATGGAGQPLDAKGSGGAGPATRQAAPIERDVVSTAELAITARDVDATAARIRGLVGVGERVDGDDRNASGADRTAHLTVRVRPDRLDDLVARIAGFGVETARTVRGEDVTTTRVDIDARVSALKTSVARLQAFLARSASVGELVALERQLTTRESDLEAMRAKQVALRDQIGLATLSVTVHGLAPAAVVAHDGVSPAGFGRAFAAGSHALAVGLRALLAALGYLLPFLLAAAVVGGAVGGIRLVQRRRRPSPPVAAEPTG
ncbi:MAG: DUF4349 domain-containing protein [bacterium]